MVKCHGTGCSACDKSLLVFYSDKLAHVQVIINCRDSIAQMCTREDKLAHNLGVPYIGDVMSYN